MSSAQETLTDRERTAALWAEIIKAVVDAAPAMNPAQLDRIKALLPASQNGDAR